MLISIKSRRARLCFLDLHLSERFRMSQAINSKSMTIGESGLAGLFAVTAFLCLIGAAKAVDAPFAFHAALGAAASLASVFVILNRYFDRTLSLPPQEING